MKCETCKYLVRILGGDFHHKHYECRRFPPIDNYTWPKVNSTDWCWEYRHFSPEGPEEESEE